LKSAPTFLNSGSLQPAPSPSVSRPPETRSTVAACFATTKGLRIGSTITDVPRRTREVFAATKASVTSGSSTRL
jgi:hypothetical protein